MKQLRNYLLLALLTFVGSAYGEGLKVSDFTISQGGTYDLAVELDDPASQYIMTDFWISLPSGVTIAKDGNGDFLAEKSDRFGQTHSFSISEGEGNAYHVLIYSSQNKPLAGNDAWLLKLKLEASENVAAGEYQGKIFSQKITDAERNNLTPAEATFKVTVQEASVVETDYFLVGSMNEWTPSDNYKLTANKESTGEYMITLDFAAGAEFQIATAAGDNQVWYPGGQENNCVINDAGNYTVYFRPDYSGGSDWFHNCIYVAPNGVEPVGLITINPSDITNGDITSALSAKIAEAETVGDIVINLAKDESYTVTASIVAPASITINGNGATIDASALESAMITTPTGDLEEWMVGDFTLKDLTVKNLKKSLFASAGKNYLYNDFLIDNCIIDIEYTGGFEFDFRKGGVAKNFTIQNSTLYAPTATANSLYTSQSAQKGTEAPGVTVQTFTFKKSTLYNIATGKNFFTHRQSNQTWLAYTLENNIFVNVGKSGQVVKGINGGQSGSNPTWTVKGNAFNFEGADTSAAEETGDEAEPVQDSVAGVMAFTSVETPDFGGTFTLAEGATQPSSLGDPRWTIAYEGGSTPELTEFYIMGTGTENEWTGTTAMTLNSETDAFEYEATLTGESYITFGDAAFTDWDDFNANHRYAIGAGDQPVTLDENNQATVQLIKVNGSLKLTTPGKYLFSVSKDLKLTITRTGDAPVEEADYYLTGTMTNWSQAAADLANYKLALNEGAEGVEYVIKNVTFEADAKFKVVKIKEGEETTWYPGGSDNDYVIQTAGNYDVYFRPNKDGGEGWHEGYIYATASSTSTLDKSALEAEIATATELLGDASTEDGTPGKALKDAIDAAKQTLESATTQDEINAAVQTLKDAEEAYKAATTPAADYYLTGTMTGWSTVAADLANYKLALNKGAEGVVEYMIKNVAFEASAQFKVIKVEEGKDPIWYPTGMDNNYTIQTAGNYDVYFRPNKDGGEGWHEGYIYATASLDKSALEDEIATATALLGDASTEEGTPGKALADAIAAAQDALQNATTQDEINNAVQALKDAEEAYKNATGIAGLYLGKYADGEWYTIQGVRIDRPTTKGLYIRNGRTVVVK